MSVSSCRPTSDAILEGLYQHRLLSTNQVHALFTPASIVRHTRRLVGDLEHAGFVVAVHEPGGRHKVLYLTPAGIEAAEATPTAETRRKLIVPEQAAGPLQRHTLAVNDVGIAFVRAARERGDEFGPLAWRHEIAHPIGAPPGRKRPEELIADALLTYQQQTADGRIQFLYRFLELDRATMPAPTLATKLARYARLYHHTLPADPGTLAVRFWQTRYPVFPTVLLVLDGKPDRRALLRRRRTVLALCAEEPDLQRTPEVEIAACLSQDLQSSGPFAAIWTTPGDPTTAVSWLGAPPDTTAPPSEDRRAAG